MLNRSPGPHVSSRIHTLCISLGHYAERDKDSQGSPIISPTILSRMQLGCALEHAISARYALQFPNQYLQIGEIEKDGIHGTPDLVCIYSTLSIHEIKLTWMSTKGGPGSEKFWKYEVQLMAYCYMLSTLIGYLHVCYVMGNYKYNPDDPGSGVIYRVWRYNFTMSELKSNWRMLLDTPDSTSDLVLLEAL